MEQKELEVRASELSSQAGKHHVLDNKTLNEANSYVLKVKEMIKGITTLVSGVMINLLSIGFGGGATGCLSPFFIEIKA